MAFCKDYNARTADKAGYVIPVEITVYDVGFLYLFLIISSVFEHFFAKINNGDGFFLFNNFPGPKLYFHFEDTPCFCFVT